MKVNFFAIAIPVLVFISVWLPEIAHYHVKTAPISNAEIESLRQTPSDAVMHASTELSLGIGVDVPDNQLVQLADMLLEGRLTLPGYETVAIQLPFDASDLDKGLSTWQLMFASLVAPEILIKAYHITQNERYFDLARAMILAWAEYERNALLPRGFLWNDHAIAARSTVLSKFWAIYRARDDFKSDEARLILQFVFRDAEMLAKPAHFTAATNHGIMQNLALFNVATVFPSLPQAKKYLQIAYQRLQDQMAFYIGNEGIVLEHSAGYHEHGIILLDKVFRYLRFNDMALPVDWVQKYNQGKQFLAQIRRPDGTLPLYGNTLSKSIYTQPLYTPTYDRFEALYPVSGYSVWWRNFQSARSIYPYSQTVLAWSHFPGHGHKLADEMSLLIWADGQDWISNTGYWPYGVPGRQHVSSWEGSNAPHLVNEAENSTRTTQQLGYLTQRELAFNHLRRDGPDGFTAHRQVIHAGPDLWIVVDSTTDPLNRSTTTTWTFASDLSADSGNWPQQILLDKPGFSCLSASFDSSMDATFMRYHGSMDPFAGWVVTEISQPVAAPSVMITRPAQDTWSVAVFALGKDCREKIAQPPTMLHWNGPESWRLALNLGGDEIRFERDGHSLVTVDAAQAISRFILSSVNQEAIVTEQNEINNAFGQVTEKYPRYNPDLIHYRVKISIALIILLSVQLLFFWGYTRMKWPYKSFIQMLGSVMWVILGCYLYFIYFKT